MTKEHQHDERFLPVPGYDQLLAGDLGTIKTASGVVLNKPRNLEIYEYIAKIHPDSKKRIPTSVHRLVALTHIPNNDETRVFVNHINGVKGDNRAVNLEWCTATENNHHAGRIGLTSKCISVDIRNVVTGEEYSFPSCNIASEALDDQSDNIILATKRPNNWVYGEGWRIKKHTEEWLPLDEENIDPATWRNGTNHNPVMIRNIKTLEEHTFTRQEDAARHMGLSDAAVSNMLRSYPRFITPDWWQIKYATEFWEPITDRWKMLAASSKLYRPIKMTDHNGVVHMFISIVECSKYLGVGATTVQYNLTSKHGQANRKGYIFEYYV